MSPNIGNFFVKTIVNSPLHPLLGRGMAVLTFEGRKTGKRYTTPINVVRDGDVFLVTSLKGRNWWRNLRGGKTLQLTLEGRQRDVYGVVVENEDKVIAEFRHYFIINPKAARFFGVRLDPKGQPVEDDLKRIADDRVFIKLFPAKIY